MNNLQDLHIVTVVTESNYYFPYLVESCKKYGKELTVLGYGKKWQGFTWRFKLMLEYLENLPESDIVCFIDGYDVLCLRDLSELKEEFIKIRNQNKCKIIVGHDKIDYSNLYYLYNYYWNYYYFGPCTKINNNDIFINAGTYIGYVHDLLYILKKLYNNTVKNFDDDQVLLINYCKKNTKELYIDIDNKLFLTINKIKSEIDDLVIIENDQLIYNNNRPFFLHGPGKTLLNNILKKLGYQDYKFEKKNTDSEAFNKMRRKRFKKELKNFLIIFFLFIIILIIFYYLYKNKYIIN